MVYYVNLFYKFMIPGVLVPMAILVVMDFTRKMINRYRKPKPVAAPETLPAPEETTPVAGEPPSDPEEVQAEIEEAPEETQVGQEPQAPEELHAAAEEAAPAPEEAQEDSEEAHHD
jgi:hypothetical protein